ncbi:MAG: electron transport complex subunit E [Ruminococcaceae bacterium]|nr:electron transport complex subunit E [Oscillospiraceae bacterium]
MNKKKVSNLKVFTNGFLKENPVLRLVLGTCPTLAVTTVLFNGIGMGIAATFVLICSNVVISALRKVIPSQVRLPCFIVVIASFVTLVQMLIKAYVPALNESLGVFLPLITVNCIILGRAEMFASKNTVGASALDGLGMGLGFTIVITLMSFVRELLGSGTLTLMPGNDALTFQILPEAVAPMSILALPPGGFFVFGVFMAIAYFIERRRGKDPEKEACAGCPSAAGCAAKGACETNGA